MMGKAVANTAIKKIVTPFAQCSSAELDTVVLACTHFPLVKQELQQALPHITSWIDSSEAIANRAGFWLHELGLHEGDDQGVCEQNEIIFTRKPDDESIVASMMKKYKMKKTGILSV